MTILANTLRAVAAVGNALFLAFAIRDGLFLVAASHMVYFILAVAPRQWLFYRKALFVACLGIACIPLLVWLAAFAVGILVETGILWTDADAHGCVFNPVLTVFFLAFQIIVAVCLPASVLASWRVCRTNSRAHGCAN